ncbi:hypothetical protein N7448_000918 [Penicillium atrosanguineum]|uniref:DUF1279 domain-containing protein n=1 Tax=Penicillium atrosanguineum TaxID=1132637 RepID=A0A9W9LD06_9EURO|nr:Protein of unknown function DUF1761 [Penicillium atrosanguineum]KAJ5134059.1 hypothetical protein N7526_005424 [Penicillium atrosanguineum]KAJ5149340.1 hypothetical protein N7448_000918 [Penicillium atrosanguineum]KAJ5304654.1 Protein of unknown function DUF1761 [Penicillium atrosanguineum]KAJ5324120.1 hypothetical protein N7476_002720 [Penicillium atrosanguineum]
MSLRPSLLSRWLPSAELLKQSTLRAAHMPSPGSIRLSLSALRSPATFKSTRRSLTTGANYIGGPAARSRPSLRAIQPLKQPLNRRYNSGSSGSSSQTEKEGNSLSQRLRKLSREYGWAAVGVYFALSALDFPFCFAAVRLLGVERIGYFEHVVVQSAKDAFHSVWPQTEPYPQNEGESEDKQASLALAEERNQENASIWTQLALAYAIHKSFIFIRVPLTAAVTPKIVKTLRRWGWDIGKRTPKSP